MPLRRDERDAIRELLGELRPDLVELHWEARWAQIEMIVALAAWRSQPLRARVEAMVDALDVARDASGPRWGRWARDPKV